MSFLKQKLNVGDSVNLLVNQKNISFIVKDISPDPYNKQNIAILFYNDAFLALVERMEDEWHLSPFIHNLTHTNSLYSTPMDIIMEKEKKKDLNNKRAAVIGLLLNKSCP